MAQGFRRWSAMTLAACAMALPGAASASRVAVDSSLESIPACSYGQPPCASTPLYTSYSGSSSALVANFGFGAFSSVYLYSNGLVSIDAPIAAGSNLSSLSTIGGNVFTAGYVPGTTYNDFQIQGPVPSTYYGNGDPASGKPVVRVLYDNQNIEFSIYDLGSGNYELQYAYGVPFPSDPNSQFTLASNGYAGYSFTGSPTVQTNGAAVNTAGSYNYFFSPAGSGTGTGTVGATPEPATWAMMLIGFAGMGLALRQKRRGLQPAG